MASSSVKRLDQLLPVGKVEAENAKQVKEVCIRTVEGWEKLQADKVTVKVVSGGITNKLFLVTSDVPLSSPVPTQVLTRVYGYKTEVLIDRERELVHLEALSKLRMGAQLYGTFRNGYVYEYLPGRPLEPEEMQDPVISALAARQLARWGKLTPRQVPGDGKPMLFQQLQRFHRAMPSGFSDEKKDAVYRKHVDPARLRNEIAELEAVLTDVGSPVAFAHNDLLCANMIYDKDAGTINFIDVEYSAWSYAMYDIANHFNEFAGFAPDYTMYPSLEVQNTWLTVYLTELNGKAPSTAELHRWQVGVEKFTLASHLFWGFWAFVQAANSDIDFDFMSYGIARLNEYHKQKKARLAARA